MTHGLIVYKTSHKEEKPEVAKEKMEKNLIELRNQIESEVYGTYPEDPDEDWFEYWEKEQGSTDRSDQIRPRFFIFLARAGSE